MFISTTLSVLLVDPACLCVFGVTDRQDTGLMFREEPYLGLWRGGPGWGWRRESLGPVSVWLTPAAPIPVDQWSDQVAAAARLITALFPRHVSQDHREKNNTTPRGNSRLWVCMGPHILDAISYWLVVFCYCVNCPRTWWWPWLGLKESTMTQTLSCFLLPGPRR